jgi:hypothetical protein
MKIRIRSKKKIVRTGTEKLKRDSPKTTVRKREDINSNNTTLPPSI